MYNKYLEQLYGKYEIKKEDFEADYKYLKNSIYKINGFWNNNFGKIDRVNLIILAEAPLWGKDEKYFYNPDTNHSQLFYKSDLEYIIRETIADKSNLILKLNNIGIVILDFSPFPFNPEKTKLSYRCDNKGRSVKIRKSDYINILIKTFSSHLKPRLEKIKEKTIDLKNIRICFRYSRVKTNLNYILEKVFLQEGFEMIKSVNSISMIGGGIDRKKLKNELAIDSVKIR